MYQSVDQHCRINHKNCGGERNRIDKSNRCFIPDTSSSDNLKKWFETFPKLIFRFQGDAEYIWFPTEYLYKENGKLCIAFDYLHGRIILGGVFMRHYDIFFNKDKKVIRFVRSKCNENDNIANYRHIQNKTKNFEFNGNSRKNKINENTFNANGKNSY